MNSNEKEPSKKTTQRIFKGLLVLIIGIILLSTIECINLLRSTQCNVHKDQQHIRNLQNRRIYPQTSGSRNKIPENDELIESTSRTTTNTTSQNVTSHHNVTNNNNNVNFITVETQRKRQQTLRKQCVKMRSRVKQSDGNLNTLFYTDKESVIYCSVPKVACTNWKRMMLYFEGKVQHPLDIDMKPKVHQQHYSKLKTLQLNERLQRLSIYYSFMFVRHPFERLLSAYRNKLMDPYNDFYQRTYGRDILKMYRTNLTKTEMSSGKNVTFNEFVQFIIYCSRNNKQLDEHWEVITKLCRPCSIKYNFIGEMDTLIIDAQQVLKDIGVSDKVQFPVNSKDKYKTDTKHIMQTYYKNVTPEQLSSLHDIYKDDFDLFGYTIPEYML